MFEKLPATWPKSFDFVISNPPYQSEKGSKQLWPDFICEAERLADCSVIVHPGRWVTNNMEEEKEKLFNSSLVSFDWFPNSESVFEGIGCTGGITISMFDKRKEKGQPVKYSINGEFKGCCDVDTMIFASDEEQELYQKMQSVGNIKSMADRTIGGYMYPKSLGYSKDKDVRFLSDERSSNSIRIWANNSYGKGTRSAWHYINKDRLEGCDERIFSSSKVMIDAKGHYYVEKIVSGGDNVVKPANIFNNAPRILDKNSTGTNCYLVFPENDDIYNLKLISSMFTTKTIRCVMSITNKDIVVRGFENVPDYTAFIPSLKHWRGNDDEVFSDEFFYDTLGFSEDLINFIETHITEKTETDSEDADDDCE